MPYLVRRMCRADIPQVTEIDRECFPTQWPPLSYRTGILANPISHYLVVLEHREDVDQPPLEDPEPGGRHSGTAHNRLKRFFRADTAHEPLTRERILGVVGFWVMAGEAHISTIAVRQAYQRLGLGELLLTAAIDLAQNLEASFVTLEVRASNSVARSLYRKYAFADIGRRKAYYSDREDAVIMSTDPIDSPTFQDHFQRLKQAHARTRGHVEFHLT